MKFIDKYYFKSFFLHKSYKIEKNLEKVKKNCCCDNLTRFKLCKLLQNANHFTILRKKIVLEHQISFYFLEIGSVCFALMVEILHLTKKMCLIFFYQRWPLHQISIIRDQLHRPEQSNQIKTRYTSCFLLQMEIFIANFYGLIFTFGINKIW